MKRFSLALLVAMIPACEGTKLNGGSTGPAPAAPDAAAPGVVVLADHQFPLAIVLDGDSVYWSSQGRGLRRVAKSGGAVTELVPWAPDDAYEGSLSIDSGSLYARTVRAGAGVVISVPLVGGAPNATGPIVGTEVAVVGGRVYSAYRTGESGGDAGIRWSIRVERQPVAGGAGDELAVPASLEARIQSVGAGLWDALAAPDGAYMSFGLGVLRIPVDGSAMTDIAVGSATALAVDDDDVYFISNSGTISAIAKSGGAARDIARVGQNNLSSLAVDDRFVYVMIATPTPALNRVPKAGGTPTALAATTLPEAFGLPGSSRAIAVDNDAVYWICGEAICKLAK